MADDGEDKPFKPSGKRLNQLRRDGQVPRSQEFGSTASLLVLLGYFFATKDAMMARFVAAFRDAPIFAPLDFWDRATQTGIMMVRLTLEMTVPYVAIVFVTAILTTILDVGGFLFSVKSLAPNFAKFNPASGIKNLFTLKSLLDLIKSLFKVVILLSCVYIIAKGNLNDAFWAPTCGEMCVMAVGWKIISQILGVGVALMLVFAGLDFFLSRWLFTRDHMMSLTEMKKESKEDSGDPHIRSARNQERKKAAESAGLTGTNAMNIVFVGKGIAVGVCYKPDRSGVPLVAVKRGDAAGTAEVLAIARERKVPVVENPDITEKLLKGRVGDAIPRDTFTPVAQALVKNGVTG